MEAHKKKFLQRLFQEKEIEWEDEFDGMEFVDVLKRYLNTYEKSNERHTKYIINKTKYLLLHK